ncbi:GMC oxidoreductase [Geminicoccaceae bacterium 1502E]|nr:GMC oxidoreductase [Geminicoccaceae bacterium 1502E]
MFVDCRSPASTPDLRCEICIAGSGMAGLGVALGFVGRKERVVVLEAGGLEAEDDGQELFRGEVVGLSYHPLDRKRQRRFGGTSGIWGGTCALLTPQDLAPRPWIPCAGWPLDEDELARHYPAANAILGIPAHEPQELETGLPPALKLTSDSFRHQLFAYSRPPTDLAARHYRALESSPTILVALHATVLEVVRDAGQQRVSALRVDVGEERSALVRARAFVLATGGLETPRLLLNSTAMDERGIGNGHDRVGRYFMDHLYFIGGRIERPRGRWKKGYGRLAVAGLPVQRGISLSDEAQRHEGIPNACIRLGKAIPARSTSRGYKALGRIARAAARLRLPEQPRDRLRELVSDPGGLRRALVELLDRRLYLRITSEQAPNPESRVTLGSGRDRFGLHRLRLDWRLSEIDKHTVRRTLALLATEFERLDAGTLRTSDWLAANDDEIWAHHHVGGSHHMGTTRMALDPQQGVVDRHCRVHGLDNLLVMGPGVFPTGGYSNPTYAVIALASRLTEHLQARLAAGAWPARE